MPQFAMKWPTSRNFAHLGEVEPGAIVEAEENPDPAFFELVKTAKGKTQAEGD